MPSNDVASLSSANDVERKNPKSADIEERRRYNREFMRRWRADPFNHAMERKKRRDWYYDQQKQRQPRARPSRNRAPDEKRGVCGLCWRRPAVTTIVRLQICGTESDKY